MSKRKIVILRLTTGEDVIAEELDTSDETITINNPVRVVVVPSRADPNNPSIAFAPWNEFCESREVTLNFRNVLFMDKPIKEFVNQYNSMFSGIVTAQQPSLILPGN